MNEYTESNINHDADSADGISNESLNDDGGSVSVPMNDVDQIDSQIDENIDSDAVPSKSDHDIQESEADSESVNSDNKEIKLSQHLNQQGRFDEDAIEYLTGLGYSPNQIRKKEKELLDIQTSYSNQFIEKYGSIENAKNVIEYFMDNYSKEQASYLADAISTDDVSRVMGYLDFAKSDMLNKQANDEPNTTSTGAAHSLSAGAFKTQEEIIEAMKDERFKVGTDYYDEVRRRLSNTSHEVIYQVPCYF
ncbi:MAG: hypothetical protein ABW127_09880 [Candidatus Thiodiazotropha endolucinida]